MLFRIKIIYYLHKLTYFKRLIYYYKKIFFSANEKNKIAKKTNKIKKIFHRNSLNKEEVVFNPVFGFEQIEYYEFLTYFFKIFESAGFKPTIFSSYKSLEIFKSANFNLKESLIYYSDINVLNNFKNIDSKLLSINEIINFKYNGIECGKFALSSTFRITRKGDIDLNNKNEKNIFFKLLFKSILNANGAINYINSHKVETGIFIDKGYVGEGELMQALTLKNKKIYNFMNYYKNNLLIIKKMDKSNTHKHPGEIDDDDWSLLKKNKLNNEIYEKIINDIKNSYIKNEWYPSAGTVVDRNFGNEEIIQNYLNFKNKKKLAVVFNHIFWDASFFYGKDIFIHYQEWFYETYKLALNNNNINWVFKLHPSNKTKNLRDNIKYDKPAELQYIEKEFGSIPEHIRILDENFPYSSFNLYNLLDFCITVRGTTGLECAMLGKPVITAGTGKYSDKGFTYDFSKKEDYILTLKNLPNLPDRDIDYSLAKKYAYYALIQKPFYIKFADVKFEKNINANLNTNININNYKEFLNSKDVMLIRDWIKSDKKDNLNF